MAKCMSCGSTPNRVLAERKYPQPIVKEDGSLLFKTIAPTLPGYKHDVANAKRLIPETVPCQKKMTLPVLQRNGKYVIMSKCNHPQCNLRGEEVTPEICGKCSLRIPLPVVLRPLSAPSIDPM